jgi:hypothetical protein
MAHIVSTSQPPNGALGDEWFNPTTNKLYQLVALGGTNVSWQDGGNIISGTSGAAASATPASVVAALSTGQGIILAANGQISANTTALAVASTSAENTFTARQNYVGNTTGTSVKFWNAAEQMAVSGITLGSAGNATVQIDLGNAAVYYFTQAATGNWTVNFRMSPGTFLNSGMGNNESISAVVMASQGSFPYYSNATQVDGVVVTPKWQDGVAPVSGNATSVDIYNYTIIKTANATYTILGSQSRFA